MFTGIIESLGTLASNLPAPSGRRLRVESPEARAWRGDGRGLAPGDSVAVAGVCLTVAGFEGGGLAFDVVPETLDRTTLGVREAGDRVNLERSLAAGDPLGGHFVQGHVDAVAEVADVVTEGGGYRLVLAMAPAIAPYIVPKGSIAIEGVSLTIAAVDPAASRFDVALVPTTLEKTTLGALCAGDRVNLETDILARTVVHYLRAVNRDGGGVGGGGGGAP